MDASVYYFCDQISRNILNNWKIKFNSHLICLFLKEQEEGKESCTLHQLVLDISNFSCLFEDMNAYVEEQYSMDIINY